MASNVNTDISGVWKAALKSYRDTTGDEITSLDCLTTAESIRHEIDTRADGFERFRHNGKKWDKFRTLVGENLGILEGAGKMAATGADGVSNRKPHLTLNPGLQAADLYIRLSPPVVLCLLLLGTS